MAIYDNDDFERRERDRPSQPASAAMNRLFRGQAAQANDVVDDDDEPSAFGGFDGGAGRGQRSVEPPEGMQNVSAELRGAMAERRERRIYRGGGSTTRPRGTNGIAA